MKFSIITCAYNPNPLIFNRLISAIAGLLIPAKTDIEWIVVDNNSKSPIVELFDFSEVHIPIVQVKEIKPGLTNARIAGVNRAKGDWLIFFDDDNEPDPSYVQQVDQLIDRFSHVKCWGPGRIEVQFEKVRGLSWISKYDKIYQERNVSGEIIQNDKKWNSNYPQGTGQVIEKSLFEDYAKKVADGTYSMSDRTGQSLSSGGDVQIVLNTIKNGASVGISEKLQLKHHIEASKANFGYLKRLIYGMASGAVLAHSQVFPDEDYNVNNKQAVSVTRVIFNYFRQHKLKAFSKDNQLIFAQRLGDFNASLMMGSTVNKPYLLKLIERFYF